MPTLTYLAVVAQFHLAIMVVPLVITAVTVPFIGNAKVDQKPR
jgi:hypothetical protein